MNAHFPQNELARAEAYGIGKLQISVCIPCSSSVDKSMLDNMQMCTLRCFFLRTMLHDLKPQSTAVWYQN